MTFLLLKSYSEGRTSGRGIVRIIKLEFEKREYKVFFDYSEIKDNEYENVTLSGSFINPKDLMTNK